jgi:hypothetical protein
MGNQQVDTQQQEEVGGAHLIRLVLSPSQQVRAQHPLGPEGPATLTQPSVKHPVV